MTDIRYKLFFVFRDRFILIYCPSRSKYYCNIHKAKWLAFLSVVILFIANSHLLFGYEKIHLNEIYDCNIRKENIFYKNLFHVYDTYIESIFFVIIPFIIYVYLFIINYLSNI